MHAFLRTSLCLAVLTAAACDEIAVADDPTALADVRGQKSCVRAVSNQTGAAGVAINTTIPVVELNRYIVDVPGANSWTCITDDAGQATQIVERMTG